MKSLMRAALQEILEAEMTEVDRDTAWRAQRGAMWLSSVGIIGNLELRLPRDQEGRFSTELFERYQRSEKALVTTLGEMYAQCAHPEGEGDHRGIMQPQLFGFGHQYYQQGAG